jgi:hypothetical protein
VPTLKVVRGRTVVGIYFSANWCTPCVQLTPLMMSLHASCRAHGTAAAKSIPPFKVILVLQCHDAAATKQYFAKMPWTAMPHAESIGHQGLALMEEFGVTSIPTLILLDGEGAVICREGQEHLWADPTGKNFPWPSTASRLPRVGFDLMLHTRPDVARLSRPLQPPGMEKPPTFQLKESASRNTRVVLPERTLAVLGTRADQRTVPPGQYESPRVGSLAGQTLGEVLGADSTPGARAKKRKALPPDTVPPKKPPPKPNLDSRRVKAVASAIFATKRKPTSLMQPQPLAEVHPFTPTLKGWRHGSVIGCLDMYRTKVLLCRTMVLLVRLTKVRR